MEQLKLGFLGFGLIGGSIAKALKSKNKKIYIHVYSRRQNSSLEEGIREGVIDEISYEIGSNFSDCSIIFLCAPVLTNIAFLKELKPYVTPNILITDVGSVKENIHKAVTRLGLEVNFIGGHPMAGSEKMGYASSTATLLENAYYFLTPCKKSQPSQLALLQQIVDDTGALCVVLEPEEHDRITAAISHVPHIIATTLVNLVRLNDTKGGVMKEFAAGGFKDITRIASSSPEMWQNICHSNQDAIHGFLQEFICLLSEFDNHLMKHEEDAIKCLFEKAGAYRDSIPSGKGSLIVRQYEIYVDIADETGAIATIATLLATNQISIKNIGIIHNREFADGVLRIELYEESICSQAATLLSSHGYTIFKRK